MLRTHNCGALRLEQVGKEVTLSGWVQRTRNLGGMTFVDLRDRYGITQLAFNMDTNVDLCSQARKLGREFVIQVTGKVIERASKNNNIPTGDIEIEVSNLNILNAAKLPPFTIEDETDGGDDLRMQYRYLDIRRNPVRENLMLRHRMSTETRKYLDSQDFVEVETPMMHSIPGGATARPFTTHHNALGMPLFLRIAPELYLKKLIVGGLPKVYEINRNFRNEGVDRSHNPEFTAMEVYEAFSDHHGMADLTESICREVAEELSGGTAVRPFGEIEIDWSSPFVRLDWRETFTKVLGFDPSDEAKVREAAQGLVENAATADVWVLANALFEERVEPTFDPSRPTFVFDYPSVISPLTRSYADRPEYCGRWDLFAGGMELGTAYTELNDPLEQRRRFEEQLGGMDDEMAKERTLDESFLDALETGMPPTGGLGIGIDRVVMLLVNATSIRDVIYFPLLRPESASEENPCDE